MRQPSNPPPPPHWAKDSIVSNWCRLLSVFGFCCWLLVAPPSSCLVFVNKLPPPDRHSKFNLGANLYFVHKQQPLLPLLGELHTQTHSLLTRAHYQLGSLPLLVTRRRSYFHHTIKKHKNTQRELIFRWITNSQPVDMITTWNDDHLSSWLAALLCVSVGRLTILDEGQVHYYAVEVSQKIWLDLVIRVTIRRSCLSQLVTIRRSHEDQDH